MTTKKSQTKECTTGLCPMPTEQPSEPIQSTSVDEVVFADPFKPLGFNKSGGLKTYSFAAEIAGKYYLKTVTSIGNNMSECLTQLGDVQIVPSSTEGFYKVVGK